MEEERRFPWEIPPEASVDPERGLAVVAVIADDLKSLESILHVLREYGCDLRKLIVSEPSLGKRALFVASECSDRSVREEVLERIRRDPEIHVVEARKAGSHCSYASFMFFPPLVHGTPVYLLKADFLGRMAVYFERAFGKEYFNLVVNALAKRAGEYVAEVIRELAGSDRKQYIQLLKHMPQETGAAILEDVVFYRNGIRYIFSYMFEKKIVEILKEQGIRKQMIFTPTLLSALTEKLFEKKVESVRVIEENEKVIVAIDFKQEQDESRKAGNVRKAGNSS